MPSITEIFHAWSAFKLPLAVVLKWRPVPDLKGGLTDKSAVSDLEPNGRETAHSSSEVIVQISERWRVISRRDNAQWVIQRRKSARPEGATWTSKGRARTRTYLMKQLTALVGEIDGSAAEALARLPQRHPTRRPRKKARTGRRHA
jgi:hypothetical protein